MFFVISILSKLEVIEKSIDVFGDLTTFMLSEAMTHNEKVFVMAGYSLNAQLGQMLDLKIFVKDNICSLIDNSSQNRRLNSDLLPIGLPSSPAIANTHVVRSCFGNNYFLRHSMSLPI